MTSTLRLGHGGKQVAAIGEVEAALGLVFRTYDVVWVHSGAH